MERSRWQGPALPPSNKPRHHQRRHRHRQDRRRDRSGQKHREIALADRDGAAELLFRQRPENEPDDRGRNRDVGAAHGVAQRAGDIENTEVEHRTVQAVDAEAREHEDAAVEPGLRDREQAHPEARERQVEHQEHHVADIERRDQAPDQVGIAREQQRPRLQAVLLERDQHDRGGRRRRKSERQQRHQHAGHRRIVGRLRAGDAFDRAFAELLRIFAELLLDRVREEGRDFSAAGGQRAERKSDGGAAQPRLPRSSPFLGGHPDAAAHRNDGLVGARCPRHDEQRLADGE